MILLVIRMLVHLKRRSEEQKVIKELMSLSDRDLRDMGVSRYDIVYKVRNGRK